MVCLPTMPMSVASPSSFCAASDVNAGPIIAASADWPDAPTWMTAPSEPTR